MNICQQCTIDFIPARIDQKYCTRKCFFKNYWNRETYKTHRKLYLDENKNIVHVKQKEYRIKNLEYKRAYLRQYNYNRLKNDINYLLLKNMRIRIYYAIKRTKKSKHTIELVGCSILELKSYLESKWAPGMNWENYNLHGWHIDHIRPCASFDLSKPEEQKKCFHYTNLQPMWAEDNWKKGARIL